ncbi:MULTISPECIES: hypothetical protein [unclassified Beijerinckia]|uniref:hypothetical protein n=1 Tax=unclassified Beijerinckia TaxID=2638183 RepID=UPI001114B59F|nr:MULTISPECIES: hypothetical protein [unclassified Beijerinckia]
MAAAITVADVGKALAIDASAANTAKLAGTDDHVIGRLETFEDRQTGKVGAVSRKGQFSLPKTGTVNVGDSVVGNGSGVVKAAVVVTPTTATPFTAAQTNNLRAVATNIVLEVNNTANTVVVELK